MAKKVADNRGALPDEFAEAYNRLIELRGRKARGPLSEEETREIDTLQKKIDQNAVRFTRARRGLSK